MISTFIKNRLKSFGFACSGIFQFFITETHAKVHCFAAFITIALSIYLDINKMDWLFIIVAIGMVLITEMVNTAMEKLVDIVSPEFSETAEFVKDVAAGSVLVAAIIAMIIGVMVFSKYL